MLQTLFTMAAVSLVPVPAGGKDALRVPGAPPPQFAFVADIKPAEGVITIRRIRHRYVPHQVQEQVLVNGIVRIVTRTTLRPTIETTDHLVPLRKTAAYNAAGKRLSEQEVLKKVRVGATVLVSGDENLVDPLYLQAVQPDTVVLVLPESTGPAPVPQPKVPGPVPPRR